MATFSIDWQETVYYNTVIDADTVEEAKTLFYKQQKENKLVPYGLHENIFEDITWIEEIE